MEINFQKHIHLCSLTDEKILRFSEKRLFLDKLGLIFDNFLQKLYSYIFGPEKFCFPTRMSGFCCCIIIKKFRRLVVIVWNAAQNSAFVPQNPWAGPLSEILLSGQGPIVPTHNSLFVRICSGRCTDKCMRWLSTHHFNHNTKISSQMIRWHCEEYSKGMGGGNGTDRLTSSFINCSTRLDVKILIREGMESTTELFQLS